MLPNLLGPGLVMLFALSQAFRDVYFAKAFQNVDFFAVIVLAFSITTVLFVVVTVVREPGALAAMWRRRSEFLWMNGTTALAWMSYFFALKHLQPSIVNTLHSGVGPLTVLVLSAFGVHIARPSSVRPAEYVCYAGLAASLVFLCWIVLAGHAGLQSASLLASVAGLAALLVSGASITVSLLISRRLNERGVGAGAVSAGRYWLIVLVALAALTFSNRPTGIADMQQLAVVALVATALIVLPLYSLQVGVARTAPLTAHVIRSLGPVFIFGLELLDGRITYSPLTLLAIALYSLFAIGSNFARGWEEEAGPENCGAPAKS